MKRSTFITMTVAAVSLPAREFATIPNLFQKAKPFKTKAGEGHLYGHLKLRGINQNILDNKVSGTDTGGGLAIFEQTSLSPGKGVPTHVHFFQDEVFFILQGHFIFQVAGEKYDLVKGDSIFLPKNIPHAWKQLSEEGKMVVIFQPAGKMEMFFKNIADLDHDPSPAEMEALFLDHEMKVVGPPISS